MQLMDNTAKEQAQKLNIEYKKDSSSGDIWVKDLTFSDGTKADR